MKGAVISALLAVASIAAPASAQAFQKGVTPNSFTAIGGNAFTTRVLGETASSVTRVDVEWRKIAPRKPAKPTNPGDPAYNWTSLDNALRAVVISGSRPLVSFLSGPAWADSKRPRWAKTGTAPGPAAFAAFTTALAKRYAGTTPDPVGPAGATLPRVSLFQGWNEPNYPNYFSGSVEDLRVLQNRFYDAVRAARPNEPDLRIGLGGLGPYGAEVIKPGVEIAPQLYLMKLLCFRGTWRLVVPIGCPVKIKLDAVDVHPYSWQADPTTRSGCPPRITRPKKCDGTVYGGALGNLPDFRYLLNGALRKQTTYPGRRIDYWITEWGWLTNPPGIAFRKSKRVLGIRVTQAADFAAESLYRMWKAGVDMALWYSTVDGKGWPGGIYFAGSTNPRSASYLANAKPKSDSSSSTSLLKAVRFPLYWSALAGRVSAWAMSPCQAPGSQVTFQARSSWLTPWVTVTTKAVNADGVAVATWQSPGTPFRLRAVARGPVPGSCPLGEASNPTAVGIP